MWSKLNSEEKNMFCNRGEHSKKDTNTVTQTNKDNILLKPCSVNLGPQINMDVLKEYARKPPEELTFGLNQRYPKRTINDNLKKGLSNYIGPFDVERLTSNSNNLFNPNKCNYKTIYRSSFRCSKLNPEVVLDFLRVPSMNKLTTLLDLMYNDSLHRLSSNNLKGREKCIRMSVDLKAFLFHLCYQKFIQFWGPDLEFAKNKLDIFILKEYKRLKRSLIKHSKRSTNISSMNLRRLLIRNGGLTRFAKKPQIIRCFYIINTFCTIIVKKFCRVIRRGLMKKTYRKNYSKDMNRTMLFNCIHSDNNILRLKLYHEGTTNKKTFLEVVDDYKQLTKCSRLNFFQLSDVRCAYENILEPGESINESDIEKCVKENNDHELFQNGTEINHSMFYKDLNTINDNYFDLHLDDSNVLPEDVINDLYMIPSFSRYLKSSYMYNSCNEVSKLPTYFVDWVSEIRDCNFTMQDNEKDKEKTKNVRINVIEKEVHVQCTSNEDHNIENENETSSHCLEEVKTSADSLEQEKTVTVNQDRDISTDSLEGKSVTNYLEAEASEKLEKVLNMVNVEQETCIDTVEDKISTKNSEEKKSEEKEKKVVVVVEEEKEKEKEEENEDDDDDDDDDEDDDDDDKDDEDGQSEVGEGTSINTLEEKSISSNYTKINKIFKKKLLTHSLKITKAEKKTLIRIINSKFDPDKINWKRYKHSTRTRLFQIIVYFGSFRMALCDELHLDRLGLKNDKICEIDKLLRSIKVEAGLLQQFFTFNGVENFLIWPLGKDIIDSVIPQSSPTINILFSFVKDIITKFCDKVKVFLRKSGSKIVLNKESLFENVSNYQIGKDVFNIELSTEYEDVPTQSSSVNIDELSTDVSEKLNTENLDLTKTSFFIEKNSSNEEICQSMIKILKSDDSILQSWIECNDSKMFKSKLLQAGVTLPIEESNTVHCSKFVEIYVRWFCEEYLQGDKFYKLALSILKNITIHIDTIGECTNTKVEMAIDNALIILYHDPCFAKAYKSYLDAKKSPKCPNSSKYENSSIDKDHSDYKDFNTKVIEEVNIEPNINVQTNTIDTNNFEMTSIISDISTSNVLNELNDVQISDSDTLNPQCSNDNLKNDFIHDFTKLLSENDDGTSNNLFENIDVDENNLFNIDLINVDDSNCNPLQFNEANPFDDFPMTNLFDDNIPIETHSVNDMLGINLQFQQDKNTEEVSLISSCDQLVNYAVSDEISLDDLNMAAVTDEYGFDNAGVLLPPYN